MGITFWENTSGRIGGSQCKTYIPELTYLRGKGTELFTDQNTSVTG